MWEKYSISLSRCVPTGTRPADPGDNSFPLCYSITSSNNCFFQHVKQSRLSTRSTSMDLLEPSLRCELSCLLPNRWSLQTSRTKRVFQYELVGCWNIMFPTSSGGVWLTRTFSVPIQVFKFDSPFTFPSLPKGTWYLLLWMRLSILNIYNFNLTVDSGS